MATEPLTTPRLTALSHSAGCACKLGPVDLGGHSVDDPEPKFGMVAIGEVHPGLLMAVPQDRRAALAQELERLKHVPGYTYAVIGTVRREAV
jgi:selenophosphate synthase